MTEQTAQTIQATPTTQKKPAVVVISQRDLMDVLFRQNKTTFVGIDSVTEPTMRKTGNRFVGKVDKHSRFCCLCGYQYEQMVNNAQKRQLTSDIRDSLAENGVPESVITAFEDSLNEVVEAAHQEFEAAKLQWGQHMDNPIMGGKSRVLIDHTNKDGVYRVYMQVAVLQTQDPVYRWKDSGEELTESEIAELKTFFTEKKEGTRQNLKKPYIIRTYALDSIKAIRINKAEYALC